MSGVGLVAAATVVCLGELDINNGTKLVVKYGPTEETFRLEACSDMLTISAMAMQHAILFLALENAAFNLMPTMAIRYE